MDQSIFFQLSITLSERKTDGHQRDFGGRLSDQRNII